MSSAASVLWIGVGLYAQLYGMVALNVALCGIHFYNAWRYRNGRRT